MSISIYICIPLITFSGKYVKCIVFVHIFLIKAFNDILLFISFSKTIFRNIKNDIFVFRYSVLLKIV